MLVRVSVGWVGEERGSRLEWSGRRVIGFGVCGGLKNYQCTLLKCCPLNELQAAMARIPEDSISGRG